MPLAKRANKTRGLTISGKLIDEKRPASIRACRYIQAVTVKFGCVDTPSKYGQKNPANRLNSPLVWCFGLSLPNIYAINQKV